MLGYVAHEMLSVGKAAASMNFSHISPVHTSLELVSGVGGPLNTMTKCLRITIQQ